MSVYAVVSAKGGIGCSSWAIALAKQAAKMKEKVCLVDMQPISCGIDVCLKSENIKGARWENLTNIDENVDVKQLVSVLPKYKNFSFLSFTSPAMPVKKEILHSVIKLLKKHFSTIILDVNKMMLLDDDFYFLVDEIIILAVRSIESAVVAREIKNIVLRNKISPLIVSVFNKDENNILTLSLFEEYVMHRISFDIPVYKLNKLRAKVKIRKGANLLLLESMCRFGIDDK